MTKTIENPQLARLTREQAADIRQRAEEMFARRDPVGDVRALKYACRKADLTQSQLAKAVGCSLTVIKNIAYGRTKLRGPRREAIWNVVVDALQKKYEREDSVLPRLAAVVRPNLVAENTALLLRVGELEGRVARLTNQLAEHIDAVRPALEKLEQEASRQGDLVLQESK